MHVDIRINPMKKSSSFGVAFFNQGEMTGMNKYRLMRGYINHKCPAKVGKLRKMRDKSFMEVAVSICPHNKGRVLYSIINMINGGKMRRLRWR